MVQVAWKMGFREIRLILGEDKNKINQMIWYFSLLKWISIHDLVFSYGHQIRKISTCQNRRKILFSIPKTKKKWLSVVKGLRDARTKVDACMAWNGIDAYVA